MIDFEKYATMIISFFSTNIFVSIGAVIVLVLCLYRKPTETVKFLGFAALLIAVIYVMSLLTQSSSDGVSYKNKTTEKTIKELTE